MSDDERFMEVGGRRWRRSDPNIPATLKSELVSELMAARRGVMTAKRGDDDAALTEARARVQDAKLALGERGRPWWERPEPEESRERLAAAIRSLLRKRGPGKSICPSDAARIAGGADWRALMPLASEVAWRLADDGWLIVTQRGKRLSAPSSGPIRLERRNE